MAQKKYLTEEERKAAERASRDRYRSKPENRTKKAAYDADYFKTKAGLRTAIRGNWTKAGIKFESEFDREIWVALAKYDGTVCAVTGMTNAEHIAKYGNRLSLDHDHQTGEPRRFLTDRTNVALGGLEALTPEQAQNLLRLHEEDRRSRNDNP
jgi:hypothetical protein